MLASAQVVHLCSTGRVALLVCLAIDQERGHLPQKQTRNGHAAPATEGDQAGRYAGNRNSTEVTWSRCSGHAVAEQRERDKRCLMTMT